MSFGFSVSDFLSLTKLAHGAYTSLKSAPAECRALKLDILTLRTMLHSLNDHANLPSSIFRSLSAESKESFGTLLTNVSVGLQELNFVLEKYKSLGERDGERLRDRFRMAVLGAREGKSGTREKLAVHIGGLNAMLTSLSAGALGRVEGLVNRSIEKSDEVLTEVRARKATEEPWWHELWKGLEFELQGAGITVAQVKRHREWLVTTIKSLVEEDKSYQGAMAFQDSLSGMDSYGTFTFPVMDYCDSLSAVNYAGSFSDAGDGQFQQPSAQGYPPQSVPKSPPIYYESNARRSLRNHVSKSFLRDADARQKVSRSDAAMFRIERMLADRNDSKMEEGQCRPGGETDAVDELGTMFDHIFDIDDEDFEPNAVEPFAQDGGNGIFFSPPSAPPTSAVAQPQAPAPSMSRPTFPKHPPSTLPIHEGSGGPLDGSPSSPPRKRVRRQASR